jgi:hypothetical protein
MLPTYLFEVSIVILAIASVAMILKLLVDAASTRPQSVPCLKALETVGQVSSMSMDIGAIVGVFLFLLGVVADLCLGL